MSGLTHPSFRIYRWWSAIVSLSLQILFPSQLLSFTFSLFVLVTRPCPFWLTSWTVVSLLTLKLIDLSQSSNLFSQSRICISFTHSSFLSASKWSKHAHKRLKCADNRLCFLFFIYAADWLDRSHSVPLSSAFREGEGCLSSHSLSFL